MNPYFIDEPAQISFSGGRTSGYMLWKVLQAHGGVLPDYVKCIFANTGREMPQTLQFVKDCQDAWGVDIAWIESDIAPVENPTPRKKFSYNYRLVDCESAARNGEPFANLLRATKYAPNPVQRFCTGKLKVVPMKNYMKDQGFDEWTQYVGIRADEKRRALKIHGQREEGNEVYCPLYVDGVTKEDVASFWSEQNFDLGLPNVNGVTDWGNCDLCFLKGLGKRLSIIRERPELADWWIEQEEWLSKNSAEPEGLSGGGWFGKDNPSYKQMKVIATDQMSLFEFDDAPSISCFCGD